MIDIHALLTKMVGDDGLTDRVSREFTITTASGPRSGVLDVRNRRIKLYGLTPADMDAPETAAMIDGLGHQPDLYTKLTVYALPGDEEEWIKRLFVREGAILGYFPGHRHADLWARYADDARMDAPRDGEHNEIVTMAAGKETKVPELADGYTCRVAKEADVPRLSELLQSTFEDYPVSLDSDTLLNAVANRANHFRCVFDAEGKMVATASAELNHVCSSAEMTDCATDPEHRGRGLMAYILWCLEKDVAERFDITDIYTLARADEVGMNCVFSKLGYHYTGRLVNNCRMPNGWESMNVWCRVREVHADAPPTLL